MLFHLKRGTTAVLMCLLVGCGDATAERSFKTPATKRAYTVLTPNKTGGTPNAILFVLHAYGAAPLDMVKQFALEKRGVEAKGWAMVVPEGVRDDRGKRFWNASEACCGDIAKRPNDLVYLREVLSDIRRRLLLQTERVFILGMDNGAFMAYRWACHASGEIRGVVAISGAGPGPSDPACTPPRSVRILHVHGDQDQVVNYYGRHERDDGHPSARETVKRWIRINKLKGPPTITRDRSVLLGKIQKERWGNGEGAVSFWTVFGGGHHMKWLKLEVPRFLSFLDTGT